MKLIRTTRLIRRQKDADVCCEIDLCQAPASADRYLVNLRQGRRGVEWRESTRTPQPVALAEAETLFALALVDRTAQGFVDLAAAPVADEPAPSAAPSLPSPAQSDADIALNTALLARLTTAHWKTLSQSQRNRTIWRIGERRLAAAVPTLVDLIQRGDNMQDYCIAWTIGRCGDPGAAIAMRELHARGNTDAVKRIALHAWLQLAAPQDVGAHADALIAAWPAPLRAAWSAAELSWFEQLHVRSDVWHTLSMSDWLEQLDQVALAYPLGRTVLLAQLRGVPLAPNTFRAVRHIYKAAELRLDAELFGLLHQRFETTPSRVDAMSYVRRSWMSFADDSLVPDNSVAYSRRTRVYLLRRGWRLLRRLGDSADPAYVEMALGALAAMDDKAAGKPYRRAGRQYDQYSHWLLFNAMLRRHGPWHTSSTGLSWYQRGAIMPAEGRQEVFPALWDARPDALLQLMRRSRCRGVHEFAARALADNTAWCADLPLAALRDLLHSPYEATARFAFNLCRQRFAPGVPDIEWLFLMLQSPLAEAQQYVIACIAQEPLLYCTDARLVALVACSPHPNVRRHARLLSQVATSVSGAVDAIVLQLLDWLDNCADIDDAVSQVAPIADDLAWLLAHSLQQAAARAPYPRVLALLDHRLSRVRMLACAWLLAHQQPVSAIPSITLAALLQEPDLGVRSMGVQLFAALPDHLLTVQADLIHAFCTHAHAGMRRAIDAVIARIGPANLEFRNTLTPMLVDSLFRSEAGEGIHADLVAWLAGALAQADMLDDSALVIRLLAARSKGAQQLGAQLLERFGHGHFGVAQWAAFGCNQNLSVRQWACAAYRAYPEQIRADMEAALRIFDTRFDDTRAFAADFFANQCSRDDWTPLLLVNLCDHLDPFVQRFGRSMITIHFDVVDVTELLLKLSQHPSPAMQLFVSAWLESATAGDADKLAQLEPYFLTVLSQVHRGRVVKSRVQAFLSEQALVSEEIAALVARLYTRQVVGNAIGDKARYIEGLRAIRARYPGLADVLVIHPPAAPSTLRKT